MGVTSDEGRVAIPPVRAFAGAEPDKACVLKPLEEAAEVYAAWQVCCVTKESCGCKRCVQTPESCHRFGALVSECCDVIQATCSLLAALGVTDLAGAMADCEKRNEERGRYGDR